MKKMTILLILSLATSLALAKGKRGGIPEALRDQLTAEQITQLENAQTREEKHRLLSSWGVEMPPPDDRHKGPPPELDEATRSELEALKTRYESASTDEEKAEIREQIRELFHSSRSDDEKKGVRRFFKDYPEKGHRFSDDESAGSAGNR